MGGRVTLLLAWRALNFIGDPPAIKVLLFWLEGKRRESFLLRSRIDDVTFDTVSGPHNKSEGTASGGCFCDVRCQGLLKGTPSEVGSYKGLVSEVWSKAASSSIEFSFLNSHLSFYPFSSFRQETERDLVFVPWDYNVTCFKIADILIEALEAYQKLKLKALCVFPSASLCFPVHPPRQNHLGTNSILGLD